MKIILLLSLKKKKKECDIFTELITGIQRGFKSFNFPWLMEKMKSV